jgi:UDP-4-amino-4,6-dideoxy-N-acetyl-beta-L-altrosamine N-acetyltransferase
MMYRKGLAIRLKTEMVTFRLPTSEDSLMVLEWRNSDAVAPYMLRADPIPQDEHEHWFSNILLGSDTAIYRIMEDAGLPSGFMSLTHLDYKHQTCEWGGYLAPSVRRGSGLGKALMYLSAVDAFERFDMNQIVVEVITGNTAAIGLYESVGFKLEKTVLNRAQHNHVPVDVLVMTLQRSTWEKSRKVIQASLIAKGLLN